MKCPQCSSLKFNAAKIRHEFEIKGESFNIIAEMNHCIDCGFSAADDMQMAEIQKRTADAYRKEKNLLTSEEIKSLRSDLGMTQAQFAEFLGVGEASVARWETFQIQDKSMDNLIRRSVTRAGEEPLWVVASHLSKIETGNVRFSLARLKELAVHMLKHGGSPLFAFKMMFYADFFSFKSNGKGITGAQYLKLEYGPVPNDYRPLLAQLKNEDRVTESARNIWTIKKAADLSVFDDNERAIIELVIQITNKLGKKKILALSHTEDAFKKTEPLHILDYKLADTLKFPLQKSK